MAFATFDPQSWVAVAKVKAALSTSPKLSLLAAGWLGSANAPQRCGQQHAAAAADETDGTTECCQHTCSTTGRR